MSIWRDPYLREIRIPDDLKTKQFRLGSARFSLLPKQYEYLQAKEEFLAYIGGYGSGKTSIGTKKAAYIATDSPGNRGLVGRLNHTDLEETTQRDLLDFLKEAELLKEPPNSRNNRALVHCVDLKTGRNLGYDSEVSFAHLDDPNHLASRHLGWFLIDEGSEVHQKAFQVLVGRLRLPAFRGSYQAMVTGNPDGHNWIWDFWFSHDRLLTITCGGAPGQHAPSCLDRDNIKCNKRVRLKRRAIHATSYENYYLPPENIDNMVASYTEEQRKRFVEASFDSFEGAIFKEFSHELHVINVA